MAMVRLHPDDLKAILTIAAVCQGERGPAACFTDRSRQELRPLYLTAIQNCEAALRDQRAKPTALKTRKSGRGV
jgi:hypothetical protein